MAKKPTKKRFDKKATKRSEKLPPEALFPWGTQKPEREHYFNNDVSLTLINETRSITITASTNQGLLEIYEKFKKEGLIDFVKEKV